MMEKVESKLIEIIQKSSDGQQKKVKTKTHFFQIT